MKIKSIEIMNLINIFISSFVGIVMIFESICNNIDIGLVCFFSLLFSSIIILRIHVEIKS